MQVGQRRTDVQETYISFYLRNNCIHVFVEALRGIGKPSRICFMIEESGETLLILPHDKIDFKSHRVPPGIYNGTRCLELYSMKLCHIIANLHNWDLSRSYRVPGKVFAEKKMAVFRLKEAEIIERAGSDALQ